MSTTFLPFLYQTRTLQRLVRSPTTRQTFRSLHISPHLLKRPSHRGQLGGDPIPFDMPSDMPSRKQRGDREDRTVDTITPAERAAFRDAFADIRARMDQDAGLAEEAPEEKGGYNWGARNEHPATPSDGDTRFMNRGINFLMADAAKQQSNTTRSKGLGTGSLIDDLKSANDPAKQLARYPASLREAARNALGLEPQGAGVEKRVKKVYKTDQAWYNPDIVGDKPGVDLAALGVSADDELGRAIENDRLRRLEHERVEQKMLACNTDAELWQVVEDDVFGLLPRLGITGDKFDTKVMDKRPELDRDIYGPLYPMLLVTSLKMLVSHFPQPSPLALSVLPRIRELGVASYALGVTTTLYNRLLEIYWGHYGDVSSVLAHLEEMRHVGLYFDKHTADTVSGISSWLKEMANGQHGDFLKAAMSMPDYEIAIQKRLKYWHMEVARSISERMDDVAA